MVPWCKKTEVVENIGSGKALTACQHGRLERVTASVQMNTLQLREGEDALVDGCELSEAASTVETTERGR